MSIDSPVLSFEQLQVRRGSRVLLSQLSGHFRAGEFIALVGENGCGKSSLLDVLAGLEVPDAGTVTLLDTPLQVWNSQTLARYRAVMQQSPATPFSFLAEDVLLLGRSHYQERLTYSIDLMLQVSQWLGLEDLLQRDIQTLSGGERQRVFLGKTLLQLFDSIPAKTIDLNLNGKILMLDEPTSALDFRHQKQVMQVLKKLTRHGLTLLCISHDINLVAPYCDQLMVLAEGTSICTGVPEEVVSESVLSRCYHTPVKLIHRHGEVPFVTH